jgi:hypothetical protein
MVSKNDLLIGTLVLIVGIIIYSFAPGGALFQKPPAHATTHYIGGGLAIVFGLVGVWMYKKLSMVGLAVSVLSVILGLVFVLDAAPSGVLYSALTPHGLAMQAVGGLTALVGLVGIAASAVMKPKK